MQDYNQDPESFKFLQTALMTLPVRWLNAQVETINALSSWSRDPTDAAASISNSMSQQDSSFLKKVVENQQVLCKLVPTGAIVQTRE